MIFFNPEEFTKDFRDEEASFEYLRQNSIPIESLLKDANIENLIAPNLNDLARLLKVCKLTNPSKIIEFGCGFSSFIFHNYLINKQEPDESKNYLHIIEVHKKYMDIACNRFKKSNKNIEVINDKMGKPYYVKNKKITKIIQKNFKIKNFKCFLSISDEKKYSTAFAIIQTS